MPIRKAVPSDIPALNNLLEQVLLVHHNVRPDIFKESGHKFNDEELKTLMSQENTPIFVFENEEGIIQDDYRIEFIKDHLVELHRAITEGANCFGYHLWTFSDCWSWLNAFKNRYGFYRVELEEEYKRVPKKSSFWMAETIQRNGFENVER